MIAHILLIVAQDILLGVMVCKAGEKDRILPFMMINGLLQFGIVMSFVAVHH